MSNLTLVCQYHPSRPACIICERCRRPICSVDVRIYKKGQSRGVGSTRRRFTTTHNYCVLCNASQLRQDAQSAFFRFIRSTITMIPFVILLFGSTITMDMFMPIFITLLIVVVVLVVSGVLIARNKAERVESEARSFRNEISNYSGPQTPFFITRKPPSSASPQMSRSY